MEHVFEKENLWEIFESADSKEGRSSSTGLGASKASGTLGSCIETSSDTTNKTAPTRQERDLEPKHKKKAFGILKLLLTKGP